MNTEYKTYVEKTKEKFLSLLDAKKIEDENEHKKTKEKALNWLDKNIIPFEKWNKNKQK